MCHCQIVSGTALAHRFYEQVVSPLIGLVPHAAALLGDGSEVLGYDDDVSTDHAFGPRLQIFLTPGTDASPVRAALGALPTRWEGFPVAFSHPRKHDGRPHHQIEVTAVETFFAEHIGVDPAFGMALEDWLLTPTQRFATLVGGAVFHDPDGLLAARRDVLRWYPGDVWRYVLAAAWLRIAQEEAFVGRAGSVGDNLGSSLVAARVARELVRLTFLLERQWAPYSKWLGTAFARLPLARHVGPPLEAALHATGWRERESALCAASSLLGAATNRLGLAENVDPAPRRFHTRDIEVLDAQRFTTALLVEVTDPNVRQLIDRLGYRGEPPAGRLPGAVDQAVDSVDILTSPVGCRAAAAALGL
jgi:Domain of unknown function (DUF4037)